MPAKLGWSAAVCACVLMFCAPAFAQDAQDAPTDPSTTAVAPSASSDTTTPTTLAPVPAQERSPAPLGPAVAGGPTPLRGEQIQITPPPTVAATSDPFLLPANSGSGRRVVYSKSQQTVWAIDENDAVVKSHRVSGRLDPLHPSPGVYRVWSRSRYTFAINNPSITWEYMVRFATGGNGGNIGFHDIPYQYGRPVQSIAQLGQPLSGGCVRQAVDDAIWMWNWADIGTVVVVTP